MRFEPALEGMRGLGLLWMLFFHSPFDWAAGGFLPIANFFALSGYLITCLFLREWETTSAIDLKSFWFRRFRRLMPAALATLAAMSLFAVFVATPLQKERMAGDVTWALLYAANWHFYLSDAAYTRLFAAPSPVHHFWSLAIEEQFYFAYPLIVVFGLRLGSGSRRVLGGLLGGLMVGSIAWAIWLSSHGATIDRIYYGSDTRASELLGGGVLAVYLYGREFRSETVKTAISWAGLAATAAMIVLWGVVDLETRWLYYGGLGAYTALPAILIAACVLPSGPARALMSMGWLRWVGRVSYGAYLFHWPIFLWLSPERTGLGVFEVFVLRMVVTFGLADLSYRFFESPIRSGRWITGWRPWLMTPAAFAGVVLAIFAATTRPAVSFAGYDPAGDISAATELVVRLRDGTPPGDEGDLPRIGVYGDSTAAALNVGLQYWLDKHGTGSPRLGTSELGCALVAAGSYRYQGKTLSNPAHCSDRTRSWPASLRRDDTELAVVSFGPWEVCDRKFPGDDQWRHAGDAVFDEHLQTEMLEAVDVFLAEGVPVVWLTHPVVEVRDPETGVPPETPYPESDPERMARYNEIVWELEKARPGRVKVLDFAGYLRGREGGELDPRYRPDGTHLSSEGTLKVAHDWLEAEILRLYRELVKNDS